MSSATLPRFDLKGWDDRDVAAPYPVYQRYRDLAPVHRGAAGPTPGTPYTYYAFAHDAVVTVLTSRDYIRNARATTDTSDSAPGPIPLEYGALRSVVENWLVFLDPPRHTALRSLLVGEFTPAVVTALRPRIIEIANELLAPLTDRAEINLVAEFAAPLPIFVISELLGVPRDHHTWLRTNTVALQEAGTTRPRDPGALARAEAAAHELTCYFTQEVARRGEGDRDDLLGLLVRARAQGAALSPEAIVGTCIHLLTAGHETTTNYLAKAALTLLGQPEALAALRADEVALPQAAEELMRFDPPVQAVTRWACADTRLGDLDIPRGSRVVALLGSANRDAARYKDPDRLDLARPADRHLGFGLGIHYCLGASLGRAEAEIGLRALVDGPLAVDRNVRQVTWADDMVFHGPTHLTLGPPAASGDHRPHPKGRQP